MQERNDNETKPWEAPSGASIDASTPLGNRPANNARRSDSADAIPRDWRGAENAADFLGLDPEVAGTLLPSPGSAARAAAEAAGAAGGPNASQSWLFGLAEGAAAEPLAPIARRSPHRPADFDAGHDAHGDEVDSEGPPPFEASYKEERPERRFAGLWMPSIAAATLIGLGVMLYKIYSVPEPAPSEGQALLSPPAAAPRTARTSRPRDDASELRLPDATVAEGGPIDRSRRDDSEPELLEDISMPAASGVSAPSEPVIAADVPPPAPPTQPDASEIAATSAYVADPSRPASERIETWMRMFGRPASPEADVLEGASDAGMGHAGNVSVHLPHAAGSPYLAPSSADAVGSTRGGDAERWTPRRDLGPAAEGGEGVPAIRGPRRATQADLAGIWEGSTVPTDAIQGSSRLLTPAVGRVRLVLNGGEMFEGRLYAVGDQKLWLDTSLGRMALLGEQVRKIEQLSGDGAPGGGSPNAAELAILPRVRVRTPGGMLYGKVIARDEATITLITEAGARVTLKSTDVEDAPPGKTTIVHPGGGS